VWTRESEWGQSGQDSGFAKSVAPAHWKKRLNYREIIATSRGVFDIQHSQETGVTVVMHVDLQQTDRCWSVLQNYVICIETLPQQFFKLFTN
jgi:hypothetical protein